MNVKDVNEMKRNNLAVSDWVYNKPKIMNGKCKLLDMDESLTKDCVNWIKYLSDRIYLQQKKPSTICGGIIYIVSLFNDVGLSQKHIATTLGVSDISIRRIYKDIVRHENCSKIQKEIGERNE